LWLRMALRPEREGGRPKKGLIFLPSNKAYYFARGKKKKKAERKGKGKTPSQVPVFANKIKKGGGGEKNRAGKSVVHLLREKKKKGEKKGRK